MSGWNFDVSQMPKGGITEAQRLVGPKGKERLVPVYHAPKIIAASKCGKVTVTKWLHEQNRWEMFHDGEQPVAWQLWPEHPTAGSGQC